MTPEQIMAAAFQDELEKIAGKVYLDGNSRPTGPVHAAEVQGAIQQKLNRNRKFNVRTVPPPYSPTVRMVPTSSSRKAPSDNSQLRAQVYRAGSRTLTAQIRNEAKARIERHNTTSSGQHVTVD